MGLNVDRLFLFDPSPQLSHPHRHLLVIWVTSQNRTYKRRPGFLEATKFSLPVAYISLN